MTLKAPFDCCDISLATDSQMPVTLSCLIQFLTLAVNVDWRRR